MAKIKCDFKEDSTLVKFRALQNGEVFVYSEYDGEAYMKTIIDNQAICLADGDIVRMDNEELVTYVKKAELNLTI